MPTQRLLADNSAYAGVMTDASVSAGVALEASMYQSRDVGEPAASLDDVWVIGRRKDDIPDVRDWYQPLIGQAFFQSLYGQMVSKRRVGKALRAPAVSL